MSLMSFIQAETTVDGEAEFLTSSETLFPGDLGKERISQSIRRGNVETGHDWLGGGGFPYKASKPCFPG